VAKFRLTHPDPKEDQFGKSVADLLDAILRPEQAIYTHIGHGGYQLSPAARGRLTRLGLKPGWPDICIAYRSGRMLWLELKTPTGRSSLNQQQRHAQLWLLGHNVVTCRRIEDVIAALTLHRVPFRSNSLTEYYHATTLDPGDAQISPPESPQSAAVEEAVGNG
jgi:hypothetical protein